MNITKVLIFATALAVLFISCEKETLYDVESPATRVTVEENKRIGYASVFLEDPTAITTKAAEYKVYNLSFFVFDSDGIRDAEYGYQTFPYTGVQYTFPVTPGENKTIIAAANLQHLGALDDADLETVQQILRRAKSLKPAETLDTGVAMTAEHSGIHTQKGDVKIVRMMLSTF